MRSNRLFSQSVLARFVSVGVLNTAFGYAMITAGLFMGLGDVLANFLGYCVGFALSFVLHRRVAFRSTDKKAVVEMARYALAVAISYGVNLVIVLIAVQALGLQGNLLVHLAAVGAYALTLYALCRTFVFPQTEAEHV